MSLNFTGETVDNGQGVQCDVLDTSKIDFTEAVRGRKTALTLVRKAEGGEPTGQNFKAGPEGAEYVARAGDAIFIGAKVFKS